MDAAGHNAPKVPYLFGYTDKKLKRFETDDEAEQAIHLAREKAASKFEIDDEAEQARHLAMKKEAYLQSLVCPPPGGAFYYETDLEEKRKKLARLKAEGGLGYGIREEPLPEAIVAKYKAKKERMLKIMPT